jgi:hypothetical protein
MGEHIIKARIQLRMIPNKIGKTASNWSTYADYIAGE